MPVFREMKWPIFQRKKDTSNMKGVGQRRANESNLEIVS
jgi:hypothetical protein